MPSSAAPAGQAPYFDVYDSKFVSIEHPFLFDTIDKATSTLGGQEKLDDLISSGGGPESLKRASLYIRPGYRLTKPLRSTNVATNNLLLEITVPRRTGRRRKRGSCELFTSPGSQNVSSDEVENVDRLLRSMHDNPNQYAVKALGQISQTHRFRNLPDFAWSSAGQPFMQKMKDYILPFDYEKLKHFTLSPSKGREVNAEIVPPPIISPQTIPFNYSYRQNPGVKSLQDADGNLITTNMQTATRLATRPVPFDIPEVPTEPSSELVPIEKLDPVVQRLVADLKEAFRKRPIFTRRSLPNHLTGNEWYTVGQSVNKLVFQYVGYIFASGPWRDGIVKFGVDPRKDPQYRIYQTMMFMVDTEVKNVKTRHGNGISPTQHYGSTKAKEARSTPTSETSTADRQSHIFDGKSIGRDGKVWQVCDIIDPVLSELLATKDIRTQCQIEGDGWYHNGLWAQVKVIMKWKLAAIQGGNATLSDFQYRRVAAAIPDIIRKGPNEVRPVLTGLTQLEKTLASQIRTASSLYRLEKGNKRVLKDTYATDEEEGSDAGIDDSRMELDDDESN